MLATFATVICFAYLLGLLLTAIPGTWQGLPLGGIIALGAGVVAAGVLPRCWRTGVKARIWLLAGLVGGLATLYFQWRVPQPTVTDISHLVTALQPRPSVALVGTIDSSPRLTQSQRLQFELEITPDAGQNSSLPNTAAPATGRVYVTVPLLQGTGFYPGQRVTVTGSLYQPRASVNPGGFDFEHYLAQKGIFAGLSADTLQSTGHQPPPSFLWQIRQRILRTQVQALGVPEGAILSAMVIGGRSIDIPFPIREQFRKTGLSHALAASGAQVSLLVGVVLALTQRCSTSLRLTCGFAILLTYLSLTGLEPAVLRAGIMGGVALLALATDRRVKPLHSMLLTATVLLLFNPLWIFDLGFQLSFLATLGLLVTVPILSRWLDWLPSGITPLLAVPIAAYLWTLPLQLSVFGIVSPYSIAINILSSPLIAVISIGGMISAATALVFSPLGGAMAAWLYLPVHLFLRLAEWGSQLPGSTVAVGTITPTQVVLLYGLFILVWVWSRLQRWWWMVGLMGISLVAVPAGYAATHLQQFTLLTTAGNPVIVWQDRGKVALINSGSDSDAKFTVLPFLTQQGINRIDWAIMPTSSSLAGWQRLAAHLPIHAFYHAALPEDAAAHRATPQLASTEADLSTMPTIVFGSTRIQRLRGLPALQVDTGEQTWLFLSDAPLPQQMALATQFPSAEVLWWSGKALSLEVLERIQPHVLITAVELPPFVQDWTQKHAATVYRTNQYALRWTPAHGFQLMDPG